MLTNKQKAIIAATILDNPYIPHKPTPKQLSFLALDTPEALYGGQAGGGKSDCLLMGALQYVQFPDYNAILFRRTYKDLSLPEALLDRAKEWLFDTDARWNDQTKTWSFPSGSKLTFGHLDYEDAKYQYQGAAFQFAGFDELTQFTESQYSYLFSRLRRLEGSDIPLRMRCASNPGGVGHEWVKARFLTTKDPTRVFIPASMHDNPYLDRKTYEESLSKLDPITRAQLQYGDWDISLSAGMFKREYFKLVDDYPRDSDLIRYWDLAATEAVPGTDPDWTAGVKVAYKDGIYYIVDVVHIRTDPGNVQKVLLTTAQLDGIKTKIYIEQEPGSAGVSVIQMYSHLLRGYSLWRNKPTGDKVTRAQPLAAAFANGNVRIVKGAWNEAFINELLTFPSEKNKLHDDQVDATSGAYLMFTETPKLQAVKSLY